MGWSNLEPSVTALIWMCWQCLFVMSDDLRPLWQSQEKSFTAHPVENWAFLSFHNHRFQLRLTPGGADLIHVPTWGFQSRNRNRFILNVKTLEGLLTSVSTLEAPVFTQRCSHGCANVHGETAAYILKAVLSALRAQLKTGRVFPVQKANTSVKTNNTVFSHCQMCWNIFFHWLSTCCVDL